MIENRPDDEIEFLKSEILDKAKRIERLRAAIKRLAAGENPATVTIDLLAGDL